MPVFLGVSPSNYFYRTWFLAIFMGYIMGVGFDYIASHPDYPALFLPATLLALGVAGLLSGLFLKVLI